MSITSGILLISLFDDFTKIRESDTRSGYFKEVYICRIDFSVTLCNKYRKRVFAFGDNLDRIGTAGQACIRPCENSVGIRTKKLPRTTKESYFTDSDYLWFCKIVEADITNLEQLNRHHPIVLSSQGYGTGLAQLPFPAPKCYGLMCDRLNSFCGVRIFNPTYRG